MVDVELVSSLVKKSSSKIILVVVDGLGGLPSPEYGKTELELANTPHLDSLASRSICGLTIAVKPGITPGSGPAHLSLFGYDPLKYEIGRGVLEALGIGFELTPLDIACRANFATRNSEGLIIDRRAGRIETSRTEELCNLLQNEIKEIDNVKIIIRPGKAHRFVVVFRGENLYAELTDSDPQKVDVPANPVTASSESASYTAKIVNKFIDYANRILEDKHPANTLLLRGFAKHPQLPTMGQLYKLTPAAIATYPMYKGLAKLVGMEVLECGETIEDEVKALQRHYDNHDFFYFHIKKTDTEGEDGNFIGKTKVIEEVDKIIPQLEELSPAVLVITSDHSTPCVLKSHSWHPNPFLLYSKNCLPDEVTRFTEKQCARGELGTFPAISVLPLLLAHALKLTKYGA